MLKRTDLPEVVGMSSTPGRRLSTIVTGETRRGLTWLTILLFAVLVATPASAASPTAGQIKDTGAMVIRTIGPDGLELPGVMVTVRGPLGTRTEQTGMNGTTRLPGLVPGTYTATLSIPGFKQVVREGIEISVGRSFEVIVAMELAPIEETVTISGESPVVDIRSTNVGSIYTSELIDMAPTASGLWAGVLDHIPGVVTDAIDVGGSEAGQQSSFSSRGGNPSQNVYALNGANTTDPEALGASSLYYSIDSLEEIGVSTAAHDVEIQTPGVILNMVSKTGSNDWHGGARIFYENDAFVSTNVTEEQRERGAGEGNPNKMLGDFSGQIGGPIIRDRAWFFIDYWNFNVERFIVGLPASDLDDTRIANWTLNGTVQIAEGHKATLRYFRDGKIRENRGAGLGTPPESSWLQDSSTQIPQLQYQGIFTPNTFLDLRLSLVSAYFPLQAQDADSPHPHPNFRGDEMPPSYERSTGSLLPGSPPTREVLFERRNYDLSGNLSYYLAEGSRNHDLKFGGNFSSTESFTPDTRGYIWGFEQRFLNEVPSEVLFWNQSGRDIFAVSKPDGPWVRGSAVGIYAQDTITFRGSATLNVGLRYDFSNSWIPAQCKPDSLFPQLGSHYQASCIEQMSDVTSWSDLVPRIGFIWDIFGDGRTALKANYSRYSNQQGVQWAAYLNPNDVGNQLYTWNDPNGDGMFQFGEQDTLLRTFFPGFNTQIDPEVKSPITDEFSVGYEREILPDFLMGATFVYRTDSNFLEDVNIGVPYGPIAAYLGVDDSYTPVSATDPGPDGVIGTTDDGAPMTIFDQDPATLGQDVYYLTNPVDRMGFDFLFNRYTGVSIVAHKRWSNNWQLLASWDIGRARGTFDDGGAGGAGSILDDPNTDINREGLTIWDRTHLVRVTGNYLLGEPFNVNLGAFLRLQSGEPIVRRAIFPAWDIETEEPELELTQGYTRIRVEPRGEHLNKYSIARLGTVAVVDLRAEKQFPLGRYGIARFFFDVFNLFNSNTETAIEVDSSATYNNIFWMVSPRVFRLGMGWEF